MAFIGRRGLSLCPWGKQTDLWVRGPTSGSCALDSAPAWPVAGSGPAQSSLRSGLCPLVPASQGCAPQRLPCSWRRKAPADMCPHRRVPDTQGSDRVEKRGALCGMRGLSLDLKLCKADPQEGRDSCGGGSQALPATRPVPDGPLPSAPRSAAGGLCSGPRHPALRPAAALEGALLPELSGRPAPSAWPLCRGGTMAAAPRLASSRFPQQTHAFATCTLPFFKF